MKKMPTLVHKFLPAATGSTEICLRPC